MRNHQTQSWDEASGILIGIKGLLYENYKNLAVLG
jgi:hypothetical protein